MKGRRLFLILAISIAVYPSPPVSPWTYNGSDGSSAVQDDSLNGHVIWLYDPATDLCFGPHGFSVCGDTNLLRVSSVGHDDHSPEANLQTALGDDEALSLPLDSLLDPAQSLLSSSPSSSSSYSSSSSSSSSNHYLHLEAVISPTSPRRRADSLCIARHILPFNPRLTVRPCSLGLFSPTRWQYNALDGRLSSPGNRCITQRGSDALLGSCGAGAYTELRPIFHTQRNRGGAKTSSGGRSSEPSGGGSAAFVCPHTGLRLPARLPQQSSQTLLAAGVYSKQAFGFLFNVFSVGWYMDKSAAATDASLADMKGLSPAELDGNPDYYAALVSPAARYDRSVLVKMAMDVKKELLIDGLVTDLQLRPDNAALLAAAGRLFKGAVCERGLELLFIWRTAHGARQEAFEIRVNGRPVTTLSAAGLGEDFFSKFVAAEPVAPVLKAGLGSGFDVFQPDSLRSSELAVDDTYDVNDDNDEDELEYALPLEAFPVPAVVAECRAYISAVQCVERIRRQRPTVLREGSASLIVLLYCALLITQSLPSRSKLLRAVRMKERIKERISSLKSSLNMSTKSFAKKCSIPSALNIIATNVSCPNLVHSR